MNFYLDKIHSLDIKKNIVKEHIYQKSIIKYFFESF